MNSPTVDADLGMSEKWTINTIEQLGFQSMMYYIQMLL